MPFVTLLRLIMLVFWHPAHTTNASGAEVASVMLLVRRKSLKTGASYYNERSFV